MLHGCCLKRIVTRLLVCDLHPLWAEDIHFLDVSKPLLLYWVLPVWILVANSYPTLSFGDHLHHCLGCSIRLLVLHVTILRIIHQSEVSGHILLISKDLRTTVLSLHPTPLALSIVPSFSTDYSKIGKDFFVGIVLLLITRYWELLLQDLLTLVDENVLIKLISATKI